MMLTLEQQLCRTCGLRRFGPIWLEDTPPDGKCPDREAGESPHAPCRKAMTSAREAVEIRRWIERECRA